ncbi:MAG: type II toxin-antitoxin system RelE/ParE family toxin [Chitinophagales bacterium]
MIKSFLDKRTMLVFEGELVKSLPAAIQKIARRKLRMANSATSLSDLKIPPANELKKLKGEFRHFYSIRINDKWRLVFRWHKGEVYEIGIVDYH